MIYKYLLAVDISSDFSFPYQIAKRVYNQVSTNIFLILFTCQWINTPCGDLCCRSSIFSAFRFLLNFDPQRFRLNFPNCSDSNLTDQFGFSIMVNEVAGRDSDCFDFARFQFIYLVVYYFKFRDGGFRT